MHICEKGACAQVSARHVTRLENTSPSNNVLQCFFANGNAFFGAVVIVQLTDLINTGTYVPVFFRYNTTYCGLQEDYVVK